MITYMPIAYSDNKNKISFAMIKLACKSICNSKLKNSDFMANLFFRYLSYVLMIEMLCLINRAFYRDVANQGVYHCINRGILYE